METRLCRICGKLGQNFVHIFRTEGLKNKIETCLPIIVSQHSLLPDTICEQCSENVHNFYSFIKNCLQNIIILEAQYDITESCLKTKRKFDKGCMVDLTVVVEKTTTQTQTQTEYFLDPSGKLVDYEIESNSNSDSHEPNQGQVVSKFDIMNKISQYVDRVLQSHRPCKRYFDDAENDLINEIAQRKNLNLKRKTTEDCAIIEHSQPKIFKMDTSKRRKCARPKKLDSSTVSQLEEPPNGLSFDALEIMVESRLNLNYDEDNQALVNQTDKETNIIPNLLPQVCFLCDSQFSGPAALTTHIFETHGIDMAEFAMANDLSNDKKKKLPNLVKISDLKRSDDNQPDQMEDPPTLSPSFVCPNCPAVFTTKPDLFVHLRTKHPDQAENLCGICLYQATTYANLKTHLDVCATQHPRNTRYSCQVCGYGDDNFKTLENHVLVHEFLLEGCKKQLRMFDPADYVDSGEGAAETKSLACSECGLNSFESFKEFSTHRRSQHQIFHCDLCSKSYGRNSHLWKHVNRLHKGHPSITCQLCYKTSASKYHLAQHFNKIHSTKPCKTKNTNNTANSITTTIPQNPVVEPTDATEDFMSQKFQAFDFQSVKQSFMKQELIEQQQLKNELDDNSSNRPSDEEQDLNNSNVNNVNNAPKEIDVSSDLYTNIITNYTPPDNKGEFKCPKCGKGFHKRPLLKKHKKNCRPRLQKDLLTRCKSCARIFKDRQSLTKHLVNYHSEYVCEICSQKVQSKCEIVSHIRFNHPNSHLTCYICQNILRSRDDLTEHTQNHLNSYICQFCGDALPSKIKLKMHILSLHRKILSLSCGVCLKLFETQHILRDHVRLVHRDELTPLTSCPVCGKNYGSKWKTYDHLNKSHGRIFRACKTCLELFDDDGQLEVHYVTAHLSQPTPTIKQPGPAPVTIKEESDSEPENDEDNSEDEEEVIAQPVSEADDGSNSKPMGGFDNATKISLLEKRLLGKKIEDDPVVKIKPKKKIKEEEFELNASPNPQNSSSKRTVYVNSNDPSYCEICFKTWPAKKHLWQHYIRCHKSVAATVCGICLKTNGDYASLQLHLRETHPTLLHGQGFGSNFICRICGRYHNASSKLKLHMAIHENFDWSLLDEPKLLVKQETNGFRGEDDDDEEDCASSPEMYDDNINYESLIEQVECSSQSEAESDDDEPNPEIKQESSSEDDSCASSNRVVASSTEETSSSFSEVKVEEDSSSVSNGATGLFRCKPEELDSAIKSISYECMDEMVANVEDEFCDMQNNHSLNENEIETAVGSIL